jgi:multidrug efflux pump subunit AcrB
VVAPGAILKTGRGDKTLSFNTRLTSLQEMGDLPVVISAGQVMPLNRLARVRKGLREQEEIVKINGRESVVVHVKAASDGNAVAIGKECRRALADYSAQGDMTFQVLADEGAFLFGIIKSLGAAILQSFALVLLIIPLFFASRRVLVCVVVLLPVSIFWTFALLRTTGFSLDQNGLAGISIALGLIVDSALVCAELAGKAESRAAFLQGQRSLVPSIIASTLTTMLALVPLYFLESIVPGIRSTACTIAFMLLASLTICLVFLPAFLWSQKTTQNYEEKSTAKSHKSKKERGKGSDTQNLFDFFDIAVKYPQIPLKGRCTRTLLRLLHRLVSWGMKKAKMCTILYGLLAVLPVVLFLLCGKDITMDVRDAVLPVYVEFDGEIAPDAVDRDCARLQGGIRAIAGVTFVSAEARKGNLEMTVGYDAKRLSRREAAKQVQGLTALTTGFLYVPDGEDAEKPKARQRGRPVSVEIAVVGDEAEVCRDAAREGAAKIGALAECAQVVLNFKAPEEMYRFVPDNMRSARAGVTTAAIAETLRWVLFGPVADKWVQDGTEMDIRVVGGKAKALNDVEGIYVPGTKGAVRLVTLGKLERGEAQGRIYRKDGRRAAYITATMMSTSMDKTIETLRAALAMVPLDANYGFSLSRDLENMSAHYRTLILAFGLCVALILLL